MARGLVAARPRAVPSRSVHPVADQWTVLGLLLLSAACGRVEPLTPGTPSPAVDRGGVAILMNVQGRYQLADFRPGLGLSLIGGPVPGAGVEHSWAEVRVALSHARALVSLTARSAPEGPSRAFHGPHPDGWRELALGDGITRTFAAADLSLIYLVSVNQPMHRVDTELLTSAGQSWDRRVHSAQSWTYPAALGVNASWAALNTPEGFEIVRGPNEPALLWATEHAGVPFFNEQSLVVSPGPNEAMQWIDLAGRPIDHPDFDGTARSLSNRGGQIVDGRVRSIVGRQVWDFGEAPAGLRPDDVLPIAGRRVLLRMGAQVELWSLEGPRRVFTAPATEQPPPPGYGAAEAQVRAMTWVVEQQLAVLAVGYVARAGRRGKEVAFALFAWRPGTGEIQRLREWASPVVGIGPFAANEAGIYWQDGNNLWFAGHEYAQPRQVELPGPLITFLGSRSP